MNIWIAVLFRVLGTSTKYLQESLEFLNCRGDNTYNCWLLCVTEWNKLLEKAAALQVQLCKRCYSEIAAQIADLQAYSRKMNLEFILRATSLIKQAMCTIKQKEGG